MGATLINITPCLAILSQQGVILTPNNRLRNKLAQAYAYRQQQDGAVNWASPAIFTLSEWLQQLYERHLLGPSPSLAATVISGPQRQALWRDIIDSDNSGAELINPGRLIADADSAYRHLELWQLSLDNLSSNLHFDHGKGESYAFQRWAAAFGSQLKRHTMITSEQLQAHINQLIASAVLDINYPVGCYGFDDIPPLTASTLALCHAQTIAVSHRRDTELTRCEYPTLNDEVQAAARWSKSILEREPHAKIGIISPNLGQIRQLFERHFCETFEPHFILPEHERYTLPFNFSAGIPLGQTPLIHDALQLLRMQTQTLNCEALCSLLYSPFWGDNADIAALLQITTHIRQLSRDAISSSQLRRLVHKLAERPAQQTDQAMIASCHYLQWLDSVLHQLADNYRRSYSKQSANRWAEFFLAQLQLWQWPGSRRLDSNEYQQMQQWLNLLEEFTQLDALELQLSHAEAIEHLAKLAATSHFQAQTPESPIQILGVLEGSGLLFSHCWVLGLNHKQWPPSSQPNPLLPVELQRTAKMPHADAERELAYAEALTRNYMSCASVVIFSSARQDDETPLQPSPLIKAIPVVDIRIAPSLVTPDLAEYQQALINGSELEWVHLADGPAVSTQEVGLLRGGSSILRDQAICPLAAFAIHRLGARAPLPPVQGLSPIDRGHILHNTLASFWSEVKTQQQLLTFTPEQQQTLLEQHITAAIAPYATRAGDIYGQEYLRLETQRQLTLITQWLDIEKQRPAFSVVATESPLSYHFHGLPLSLRLDRLDCLETGELIVIDYKTGSPATKSWQGEYPSEPQLPLYTLCYSADIHALMFVEINARNTRCNGLGHLSVSHDGIIPITAHQLDLPDSWPDVLAHWDRVLGQLTTDFLNGEAVAEFTSNQHKRNYDDLLPVMRLYEQPKLQHLYRTFGARPLTSNERFTTENEGGV